MYGRGKVSGIKREKPGAQDWYASIVEETLRQLDALEATTPQPQEESPSAP